MLPLTCIDVRLYVRMYIRTYAPCDLCRKSSLASVVVLGRECLPYGWPCEEEDRRTGREGERERMGNDEGWEKGEVRRGGEGDGIKSYWSSLDVCMQNTFVLLTGKSDNEYVRWVGYYLKAECYLIMTSNFIE